LLFRPNLAVGSGSPREQKGKKKANEKEGLNRGSTQVVKPISKRKSIPAESAAKNRGELPGQSDLKKEGGSPTLTYSEGGCLKEGLTQKAGLSLRSLEKKKADIGGGERISVGRKGRKSESSDPEGVSGFH